MASHELVTGEMYGESNIRSISRVSNKTLTQLNSDLCLNFFFIKKLWNSPFLFQPMNKRKIFILHEDKITLNIVILEPYKTYFLKERMRSYPLKSVIQAGVVPSGS